MDAKQIAILLAIAGAAVFLINQAQPQGESTEFKTWKSTFGIRYESEMENAYREKIFLENLAKIEAHNSESFITYKMGINQFTGMTDEEFVQTYLGTIVPSENVIEESTQENGDVSVGDVDWVSQGAVTPIKDQGKCGSCWAFSTTGSLEGLSKLGFGSLKSFSEQQLVDCSNKYGNQGCNGGLMDNAFKYVKDNGICDESDYAYVAKQHFKCSVKGGDFKISGFTDIKNCNDLANGLTGRPISVAVDASNWSKYSSGVFSNCNTSLNHGVLLVGATDDYWKVKNSWSAKWGESGYIRLARGNTCGICNVASYPNK